MINLGEVIDAAEPQGGLMPAVSAERELQRELTRRVNAAVLRDVHGLEDLPAVARWLLEDEGVEPDEAARDPLGGYWVCCEAIWAAVGRPVRQRTFEEILGR